MGGLWAPSFRQPALGVVNCVRLQCTESLRSNETPSQNYARTIERSFQGLVCMLDVWSAVIVGEYQSTEFYWQRLVYC